MPSQDEWAVKKEAEDVTYPLLPVITLQLSAKWRFQ
jgi:hypothetical protein